MMTSMEELKHKARIIRDFAQGPARFMAVFEPISGISFKGFNSFQHLDSERTARPGIHGSYFDSQIASRSVVSPESADITLIHKDRSRLQGGMLCETTTGLMSGAYFRYYHFSPASDVIPQAKCELMIAASIEPLRLARWVADLEEQSPAGALRVYTAFCKYWPELQGELDAWRKEWFIPTPTARSGSQVPRNQDRIAPGIKR